MGEARARGTFEERRRKPKGPVRKKPVPEPRYFHISRLAWCDPPLHEGMRPEPKLEPRGVTFRYADRVRRVLDPKQQRLVMAPIPGQPEAML